MRGESGRVGGRETAAARWARVGRVPLSPATKPGGRDGSRRHNRLSEKAFRRRRAKHGSERRRRPDRGPPPGAGDRGVDQGSSPRRGRCRRRDPHSRPARLPRSASRSGARRRDGAEAPLEAGSGEITECAGRSLPPLVDLDPLPAGAPATTLRNLMTSTFGCIVPPILRWMRSISGSDCGSRWNCSPRVAGAGAGGRSGRSDRRRRARPVSRASRGRAIREEITSSRRCVEGPLLPVRRERDGREFAAHGASTRTILRAAKRANQTGEVRTISGPKRVSPRADSSR